MYVLDTNSIIVKIWADYVKRGKKTIDEVPEAFGMRAGVKKLLGIVDAPAEEPKEGAR